MNTNEFWVFDLPRRPTSTSPPPKKKKGRERMVEDEVFTDYEEEYLGMECAGEVHFESAGGIWYTTYGGVGSVMKAFMDASFSGLVKSLTYEDLREAWSSGSVEETIREATKDSVREHLSHLNKTLGELDIVMRPNGAFVIEFFICESFRRSRLERPSSPVRFRG